MVTAVVMGVVIGLVVAECEDDDTMIPSFVGNPRTIRGDCEKGDDEEEENRLVMGRGTRKKGTSDTRFGWKTVEYQWSRRAVVQHRTQR